MTAAPTATAQHRASRDERAARWEQRLALPVIVAAMVSVPAVFLTVAADERYALAGHALNWASLAVFTGEAIVLFILSGDRITWARRHWWKLAITALAIPAVILAIGPVQVLRLIQFVGALRILRASRIIKAGRVLARRLGLSGRWRHLPVLAGSTLAAAFVAVVLADPTSTTRQWLEDADPAVATGLVVLAGAILAAATFVVLRYRNPRRGPDNPR